MSRDYRAMRKVGDVVPKALDDSELVKVSKAQACLRHWKEIVGPGLFERSRPDRYARGVVWVAVQGSAWAQELRFMKELILSRLRDLSGDPSLFKDVRFGVRPLPVEPPAGPVGSEDAPVPPETPKRELSIREIAERRLAKWRDVDLS